MTIDQTDNSGPPTSGILVYFVVAMGFTWAAHFSIMASGAPFTMDLAGVPMRLYLIGLAGPLIAAVSVSAWQAGWKGVRALLAQGVKWRFPFRWYLVAILLIPAVNLTNI